MSEAQVLVEVTRGVLVENLHRGHVAVVDSRGKLLYSTGDPWHMTYWRSSAKPVQVLPVVEQGAAEYYSFTDRELALFCASHSGEAVHTDTVEKVLEKIGLDKSALQCGVHDPVHKETARQLIEKGVKPNALHHNCSGKHAGMLSLASYKGFDLSTYTEITNPLQQLILDYIANLTGYPRGDITIGIDGCGVPVHGMPLYNMALAFARMAAPAGLPDSTSEACRRISRAMYNCPEMVGGTDRFCTDLMRETKGKLIGKAGAAGVYCAGMIDSGTGIAIKCEDGQGKARDSATMEVLSQLNILDSTALASLSSYHRPANKNHRREVCGEYIPAVKLQ